MKSNDTLLLLLLIPAWLLTVNSCTHKVQPQPVTFETIKTNQNGTGQALTLEFTGGSAHNHPLMVVWIETDNGEYIQTLFVAESIGKGVFKYSTPASGKWMPGSILRPAALPYWGHKRGIKTAEGLFLPSAENPVPDAYTGPTPTSHFILETKADNPLPQRFRVLLEINQSWDWNEYWTNNKYPDNKEYKTSSQPSIIYAAEVNLDQPTREVTFTPIGHGHYAGEDGILYTDLTTITTALNITSSIKLKIK